MTVKVFSNDVYGSVEDNIFNYSYSEDAISLNPVNIDGGAGQCSFSTLNIPFNVSTPQYPTSFLINNSLTLKDSSRGSIFFNVKQISRNDEISSISGDSIQNNLNVEKSAKPFFTASATYGWTYSANSSVSIKYDMYSAIASKNYIAQDPKTTLYGPWGFSASTNFARVTDAFVPNTNSLKLTATAEIGGLYSSVSSIYDDNSLTNLENGKMYTLSFYIKKGSSYPTTYDSSWYVQSEVSDGFNFLYEQKKFTITESWQKVYLPFKYIDDGISGGFLFTLMTDKFLIGESILLNGTMLNEGIFPEPYFDGSVSTGVDNVFNGKLSGAINYYASLCNTIVDTSGITSDASNLNFIGWTGNVWEYIKQLCSAFSIDAYVSGQTVYFKNAETTTSSIDLKNISSYSETISLSDAAQSIDVYNYNTEFKTDSIIYTMENYDENIDPKKAFLSTILDSFQVNAGETITKVFDVDISLIKINQPTCVSQISSLPYAGTTGEYVIVGNDDLEILPEQWTGEGGVLKVEIGDTPNQIKLTVTGPNTDSLISKDGETATYAPYRIGVESSGDGTDYPAIYITGTGVYSKKTKTSYVTGSDVSTTQKDASETIDNIFITNKNLQATKGVIAAQDLCGPKIETSFDYLDDLQFGSQVGTIFFNERKKFRIKNLNYNESNISISCSTSTSFSDYNSKVGALSTFASAYTKGTFHDFTTAPLFS